MSENAINPVENMVRYLANIGAPRRQGGRVQSSDGKAALELKAGANRAKLAREMGCTPKDIDRIHARIEHNDGIARSLAVPSEPVKPIAHPIEWPVGYSGFHADSCTVMDAYGIPAASEVRIVRAKLEGPARWAHLAQYFD